MSSIANLWRLAAVAAAVLVGTGAGVGGYTFLYAEGGSYLSDNPEACANCHVMQGQLDAWVKSSHAAVATCNDCHTPGALIPKYWVKAQNGYHHSFAFTTGRFHEPIRITPGNRAVTQAACRRCHEAAVAAIDAPGHREALDCIRCHDGVGHGP